jgi:hypothetical protein
MLKISPVGVAIKVNEGEPGRFFKNPLRTKSHEFLITVAAAYIEKMFVILTPGKKKRLPV